MFIPGMLRRRELDQELFINHDLHSFDESDVIKKNLSIDKIKKYLEAGRTVQTKDLFEYATGVYATTPQAFEKAVELNKPVYFVDPKFPTIRICIDPKEKYANIFLGSEIRPLTGLEWYRASSVVSELVDRLDLKNRHDLIEQILDKFERLKPDMKDFSYLYAVDELIDAYGERKVEEYVENSKRSPLDRLFNGYTDTNVIPLCNGKLYQCLGLALTHIANTDVKIENGIEYPLWDFLEEEADVKIKEENGQIILEKDGEKIVSVRGLGHYSLVESRDVDGAIESLQKLQDICFDTGFKEKYLAIDSLEMLIKALETSSYVMKSYSGSDFNNFHVVRECEHRPYAVFVDKETEERAIGVLAKQLFEVYNRAWPVKRKGIRKTEDMFADFVDDLKGQYGYLAKEARERVHEFLAENYPNDTKKIKDFDSRFDRHENDGKRRKKAKAAIVGGLLWGAYEAGGGVGLTDAIETAVGMANGMNFGTAWQTALRANNVDSWSGFFGLNPNYKPVLSRAITLHKHCPEIYKILIERPVQWNGPFPVQDLEQLLKAGLSGDPDMDGLSTNDEVFKYGTNPLDPDTDDDENTDYEETEGWVKKLGEKINPGYVDPLKFSPLFSIFNEEGSDGYIVDILKKRVVYILPGAIHDLRMPGSNIDLTHDEVLYHNLLLGFLNKDGIWDWSWGNRREFFSITKPWGKSIAWNESNIHDDLGFRNRLIANLSLVENKYLVLKVDNIFEALKDIRNVVDLYNEFGYEIDAYKYVALKDAEGKILIQDMSRRPEDWYFWDRPIKPLSWLSAYNSRINDASIAVIYNKAELIKPDGSLGSLDPRLVAYDSDGTYNNLDAIGLTILDIVPWDGGVVISKGSKYHSVTYIVVNDGKQDYSWIDIVLK